MGNLKILWQKPNIVWQCFLHIFSKDICNYFTEFVLRKE